MDTTVAAFGIHAMVEPRDHCEIPSMARQRLEQLRDVITRTLLLGEKQLRYETKIEPDTHHPHRNGTPGRIADCHRIQMRQRQRRTTDTAQK